MSDRCVISPTPHRGRRTPARHGLLRPVLALLLVAALSLSGCSLGSDDPEPLPTPAPSASSPAPSSATPSPSESPSPSGSPSGAPSESASPTPEPSPSAPEPTPTSAQPAPLTSALLAAGDVPGFNDSFRWRSGTTRAREPQQLAGTCHKFPMLSVGATEVAYRTFRPPTNTNAVATQLVADFADAKTAARAYRTVLSWRRPCPEKLTSYPRVDVGLLRDVDLSGVPGGGPREGGWWLALYGPIGDDPDVSAFDAEGVVRVGSRISVMHLLSYGQDYIYEPGQEPAAEAVRRAAAALG